MTNADLDAIRNRIYRAFDAAQSVSGLGYDTSYQAKGSDFVTHLRTNGVKSPEQIEDDFLNLFVWLWSLKDYLKSCFVKKGLSGQEIEELVNRTKALTYVADIANRAKHGTLQNSRSGEYAELIGVGFEASQDAIERIIFAGPNVTLDIKNTDLVLIRATVSTRAGKKIDALTVLKEALDAWEHLALARIIP